MLDSTGAIDAITLCFADNFFEAAFKADVFRNAYRFHLLAFGMLIVVLAFGMRDPSFRLISTCLLPLGALELALRVGLHAMHDEVEASRLYTDTQRERVLANLHAMAKVRV